MGVGGTPRPINERVRPSARKLDIRGVVSDGNGTGPEMLEVRVIVDGVRVVSVGEGGKTNNVCEGVETWEGGGMDLPVFLRKLFRR